MELTKPTLILEHVTKRFSNFTAVSDLSLQVRPGRVFGLIGPNGAGKTTTIRMIVNITVPDSGRIELFGQRLSITLQDRIGQLVEDLVFADLVAVAQHRRSPVGQGRASDDQRYAAPGLFVKPRGPAFSALPLRPGSS